MTNRSRRLLQGTPLATETHPAYSHLRRSVRSRSSFLWVLAHLRDRTLRLRVRISRARVTARYRGPPLEDTRDTVTTPARGSDTDFPPTMEPRAAWVTPRSPTAEDRRPAESFDGLRFLSGDAERRSPIAASPRTNGTSCPKESGVLPSPGGPYTNFVRVRTELQGCGRPSAPLRSAKPPLRSAPGLLSQDRSFAQPRWSPFGPSVLRKASGPKAS